MNAPSVQPGPASAKTEAGPLVWALLALAVCLVAISRQSLWIDEALTATKAAQPTFPDWWRALLGDRGSDLQMPLYLGYVWAWAKIFGIGEWTLRAANIPWFVAGFLAFITTISGPKRVAFGLVVLLCPFAWYYLDEARPYAMQLGASLMIFGALRRLSGEGMSPGRESRWLGLYVLGLVSLSGSSLLGMIWALAAVLSLPLIFSWKRLGGLVRSHGLGCAVAAGLLATGAGYYLWTLKLGARASAVGSTDGRNILFIAYELSGLAGLGPGRLELREDGLGALVPFAKQLAVQGVLIFDLLMLGGWRIWRTEPRVKLAGLALAIGGPAVILIGSGYALHYRVLGRHFMPLLPVVLSVLGLGLSLRWARRHWMSRLLACAFIVLSLASCLSLRFAARHGKDDYRDAAAFANEALRRGWTVWWNAGWEGGSYYRVPLSARPNPGARAIWLMNPAAEQLSRLPVPEIIITSKSDVYDGQGILAGYLRAGSYFKLATLPAFTVWQRKDERPPRRI